jgi:hypothetical protein
MSNILSYSIARERIEGSIGAQTFSLVAWSGGRRGAKGDGAEYDPASYNVFQKENHSKGIHGGPIPPGIYLCHYVAHHHKFGECVFLEQTITALFQVDSQAHLRLYDRDGFYIHGRGPHGSDGCIVPESNAERHRLNKAVKGASGTVMLQVNEQGYPLPAAVESQTRYA